MMIRRKVWMEHENYQLWLGHKLNVSMKVLEEYLGRSVTAINKQLDRSGIRDNVAKNKKPGFKVPKIKVCEHFENIIIMAGLDDLTVGLERQHTRNWQPSIFTKTALDLYGIDGNAPWAAKDVSKKLPVKSRIGRRPLNDIYTMVSTDTCAHYLIRNGFKVSYYHKRNPFQWTYLLNNKPTTDAGLLRQTNIVRASNNEPLFYIKGVTFEG